MTNLELLKKILAYPAQVCKHAVCLDILDMMERNGQNINEGLVEALSNAEDDYANNLLDILISEQNERKEESRLNTERVVKMLKSIPGLPSIGCAISDAEMDAAMEHGLNHMVVKTPEEEEMLKKAMAEQAEDMKKAFAQEMLKVKEQNKEKEHLIPKFKAGDKAWSPYQLICSTENIDRKWDVEEVEICKIDAISDDMYNPSRGVVYIAWSRSRARTHRIHQDSLYKTKEEAENHKL